MEPEVALPMNGRLSTSRSCRLASSLPATCGFRLGRPSAVSKHASLIAALAICVVAEGCSSDEESANPGTPADVGGANGNGEVVGHDGDDHPDSSLATNDSLSASTDIGVAAGADALDASVGSTYVDAQSSGETQGADAEDTSEACIHDYWTDNPFPGLQGETRRVVRLPGADFLAVGLYAKPGSKTLQMGATRYNDLGVKTWKTWVWKVAPSDGPYLHANPSDTAADATRLYIGWDAAVKPEGLAEPGWRVAAMDHSGQLKWSKPQENGRTVAVTCLAAAATTVFAVGEEIEHKVSGNEKMEVRTPVVGQLSPSGQVLSVTSVPEYQGALPACAFDEPKLTLALAGGHEGKGWVGARVNGSWAFIKTVAPPYGAIGGELRGITTASAGGYVAVGMVKHSTSPWVSWILGMDSKGQVEFSKHQAPFFDYSLSPVSLPSGGFATLSRLRIVLTQEVAVVQHFDRWGNRLGYALVGEVKFVDGPNSYYMTEGFAGEEMLLTTKKALVIVGRRDQTKDAAGNLEQLGLVYHTDIWGYATCAMAGKCGALTLADCDDSDPCTRDMCKPDYGCVNVPWKDGTTCGVGMVCQAGVCTAK